MFARDESKGEKPLELATHGEIKVLTSRDLCIRGAIGCCSEVINDSNNSSTMHTNSNIGSVSNYLTNVSKDNVIGMSGTNTWKCCGLDKESTIAIFFQPQAKNREEAVNSSQFFIQFQSTYSPSTTSGTVLRVTTISRRLVHAVSDTSTSSQNNNGNSNSMNDNYINEIASGFDQETAAVLMARLAAWKMESEEEFDATR